MKPVAHILWTLFVIVGSVLAVVAVRQQQASVSGENGTLQPESAAGGAARPGEGSSRQSRVSNEESGITVVVHPRNAPVTSMVTQQFTATVKGTGNTGVTWYVDGVKGGYKKVGTIDANGLYTPPANFVIGTHTIKAVSQADTTKLGRAAAYLVGYAGMYTNKNDNARTGQNLQETVLTPKNVNVKTFGKVFSYPIDEAVLAQPLYVANVYIPKPLNGSAGYHNVVYVATENATVYAYDADGKVLQGPLWRDSFINPPNVISVPGVCLDTLGKWGITPTPVIDPTTNTMYVQVRTLENPKGQCNGTYSYHLHALDITTGQEKFGGPVVIKASVPGRGIGGVNGVVSFKPRFEDSRVGLLLSKSAQDDNSVVYMAAASIADTEPWHGWVLGFDSQTLALKYVFCTTPDGEAGGVWQMGAGLAADTKGDMFLQTGNGTFDNVTDFGLSVLKLTPKNGSLALADYYTPSNYRHLNSNDWDVSSGGILLLPDQPGNYPHLMVGGGKEGTIYLMNRDNLGGYNANGDDIVQYIVGAIRPSVPNHEPFFGIWNASSYFQGNVYISGKYDYPKMFTLNNGLLPTTATSTGTVVMDAPVAIISANGANNGIVWMLQHERPTPTLRAFNPNDLTQEYYDTNQNPTRDEVAFIGMHRVNPLVANGRVYVPAISKLKVYGLLP
jgi:hypothetical protein